MNQQEVICKIMLLIKQSQSPSPSSFSEEGYFLIYIADIPTLQKPCPCQTALWQEKLRFSFEVLRLKQQTDFKRDSKESLEKFYQSLKEKQLRKQAINLCSCWDAGLGGKEKKPCPFELESTKASMLSKGGWQVPSQQKREGE